MADVENCRSCAYWMSHHPQEHWRPYEFRADCRRHSPIAVEGNHRGQAVTIWPITNHNQFCGDFELCG